MTPPPATSLANAFRLCDPFTPLDPRLNAVLHADLTAIRGGDRLAKIVRSIEWSGGTPTLHFLSGHLGSGKTTELLRMKDSLETASGENPLSTVLFLDADTMLNRHNVEDSRTSSWRSGQSSTTGRRRSRSSRSRPYGSGKSSRPSPVSS